MDFRAIVAQGFFRAPWPIRAKASFRCAIRGNTLCSMRRDACCSVPIRAWSIAWARRCACAFRRCTPMLAAPTLTLCAASAPGSSPESNALFLARLFSSRRRGILKVRNTVGKGPSCFLRNRFLICARRAFCIAGAPIAAGGRSVYDRRVRYDGESTIINAVVASQTSSTEGYRVMVELNEGRRFRRRLLLYMPGRRFSTTACASMRWRSRSITQLVPIAMRLSPRSFCRIFRLHRRVHGARRTPRA